jgi:hypothetical protein
MKKKLIISIFVLLSASSLLYAFQYTYDGLDTNVYDNNRIVPARGGYMIIADGDENDGLVFMIDASGNSLWTRTYPNYLIKDAIMDQAGYFLTAVFCTDGSGEGSVAHLQTDMNGDCVWARTADEILAMPHTTIAATDSGYITAGTRYNGNDTTGTMFLEKVDSSGDCVWVRSYGESLYPATILAAADGGYVIAGASYDSYGLMMKVDSAGNSLWSWTTDNIPDTNYMFFNGMVNTGDGYMIAGNTWVDSNPTSAALYLLKADYSGNTLWTHTYDWNIYHQTWDFCGTGNNDYGFLLAGTAQPAYGSDASNVIVMQVDLQGNCRNAVSYNAMIDPADIYLWSPKIVNTTGGKYILTAGTFSTLYDDGDLFVADGSFPPLFTQPITGGESSGKNYACPQPARDSINFVYALDSDSEVTIYIYNFANRLAGKSVTNEKSGDSVTTTVDITNLPAGVYFYQITAKHIDGSVKRYSPAKFMVLKTRTP